MKLVINLKKIYQLSFAWSGTGFYQLFQYEVEGDFIAKMELAFKRDEKIMRFLTVKLDKHAVEYAKVRIEKVKSFAKAAK